MKKQIILASMAALLFSGSTFAMSQPVFETQAEFEKYQGKTCKQATDGCNTFGVEGGKVTYGTEMFCENHTTKWTCLDSKKDTIIDTYIVSVKADADMKTVIKLVDAINGADVKEVIFNQGDTKMFTVKLDAPMIVSEIEKISWVSYVEQDQIVSIQNLTTSSNINKAPDVIYGTIREIENGKDGQQIHIVTPEGKKYNTAVSVHDTIVWENISGLYLGTRVKIYYTDEVAAMNLLIWDKVEIISVGLSHNDISFYEVLKKDINKNFQSRIETFIVNYKKKMSKYDTEKRIAINNKIVDKIEALTSNLLDKYPQDIALPKKANDLYLKLEYLKFSFMDIDFYTK